MTRTDRSNRTAVLELALTAPAVLCLIAALLGIVIGARSGAGTSAEPLTMSEAAALRDRAELLRLIGTGADARARARVRGGIIREQAYMLTPLEAATATQRDDVVRLLVGQGVPLDDSSFPVVYCIAAISDFEDIVELLGELAPDRQVPQCDDVRLPL